MNEQKEYLIENLALLLDSGMNVLASLEAIRTETRSGTMKKKITAMIADVDNGSTLWHALEATKMYQGYIISLVRIGEESGRLPENLQIIVNQQKKQRTLTSRLRSALIYPGIVLSMTVILGLGIAWFILPNLAKVFASLHLKLPLISQILIGTGVFLGKYGIIVVPSIIFGMLFMIFILFINKKTKFIGEMILFNTPGVRGLIKEVELARFGYILGNMLESGIIIIDAMDSMKAAITLKPYRKLYQHLADSIESGNSFQKSFKSYKGIDRLMPPHIQQMVVAGEQSGRLPNTLIKIGETYETKTENTTKNLEVLLEPILLIVMGVGVLFVALGIIVPIYSLVGGLNGQTDAPGSAVHSVAPSDQVAPRLPVIEVTGEAQ